ncbi:hypothetical protein ANAEL_01998 [Anaerolineales bacterium]|nr:hypothetical protein ANAEL_01998 [Anaerolineales bacterium]
MKQDKFLIGILIGIGVLILLALVLFFLRKDGQSEYIADSIPEGVTHNYVLAILNKDYQKAYGYLADLENKPTYEQFRQSFFNGSVNPTDAGVEVGTAEINGDEAIVTLSVYYSVNDPFSSRYASEDRALLVQQNGAWKLSAMPFNFWGYDWYQEPFKP